LQILAPGIKMCDQITIDEEFMNEIKRNANFEEVKEEISTKKKSKSASKIKKGKGA